MEVVGPAVSSAAEEPHAVHKAVSVPPLVLQSGSDVQQGQPKQREYADLVPRFEDGGQRLVGGHSSRVRSSSRVLEFRWMVLTGYPLQRLVPAMGTNDEDGPAS